MATETAVLPHQIEHVMAGSPYWTRVRRARFLLAAHLGRNWNVNLRIRDSEPWIYVTAIDDGDVFIEGVRREAIRTFECTAENACRRIAEKTHRVSTDEEIIAFIADRREREAFCAKEDERSNPVKAAQKAAADSSIAMTLAAQAIARNAEATMLHMTNQKPPQEAESDPDGKPKIQRRG